MHCACTTVACRYLTGTRHWTNVCRDQLTRHYGPPVCTVLSCVVKKLSAGPYTDQRADGNNNNRQVDNRLYETVMIMRIVKLD